ncbi:MAG: ACT domain-containing protein [Actinobacteria bacterium]|nr:ACT domain-containing protein [Actinomycetota bacterium]
MKAAPSCFKSKRRSASVSRLKHGGLGSALSAAGMSCNVLAGYHHDHLLVPEDRADEAFAILSALEVP